MENLRKLTCQTNSIYIDAETVTVDIKGIPTSWLLENNIMDTCLMLASDLGLKLIITGA